MVSWKERNLRLFFASLYEMAPLEMRYLKKEQKNNSQDLVWASANNFERGRQLTDCNLASCSVSNHLLHEGGLKNIKELG